MKKLLPYLTLAVLTGTLCFRYLPWLIPVRSAEMAGEDFHSVTFYDRDGHLLQEVLSESSNRSVRIPLTEVCPYFLDAIVAAEDKNFYHHRGVDYGAVLRAIYLNLRAGRIISGASTITLQLARLMHPAERTLGSKIRETFLAFRMEAGMDKEAILEAYINRLPMGGNLYGVESAARAYFGIPAADLTLAQAAFLASIPNAPNRLDPYHHLPEIKKRQRTILRRMARNDLVAPGRIEGIIKEDVLLKPQSFSFLAPHSTFRLINRLPPGAHTVKTALDGEMQRMVAGQIDGVLTRLQNYHVTNAAVLLLENRTGEVLAYLGSADYFDENTDGNCDGVRALRQPGSALKPFLYLLAMEAGWNPATLISDIPTSYPMPAGTYAPTNYSKTYNGPVRVREALANSLNIPAVRTLAACGTDRFLSRLHQYGFRSLDQEADHYGLGLALGGGEVTLFQLTRAYLCLARLGRYGPVRSVLEINGLPYEKPDDRRRIGAPELNYLIADILGDRSARVAEFGFNSILNLPFPCYVKTGTSHRFCDNWAVGFTSDYTLGVWVGNFDHTPMLKVSGVSGAGPIWANIMMLLYHRKQRPDALSRPPGLVRVPICTLSGKRPVPECPAVVEELIPERDLRDYHLNRCKMHLRRGSRSITAVPARYQAWAERLGMDVQSDADQAPDDSGGADLFRIANPVDGAVYHRHSNLASQYQSLRVRLDGSNRESGVRWLLNGELIGITRGEHDFLWRIEPGDFVLTAVSEDDPGRRSRVDFQVR
jgi:penicillin-binding protein 1C